MANSFSSTNPSQCNHVSNRDSRFENTRARPSEQLVHGLFSCCSCARTEQIARALRLSLKVDGKSGAVAAKQCEQVFDKVSRWKEQPGATAGMICGTKLETIGFRLCRNAACVQSSTAP